MGFDVTGMQMKTEPASYFDSTLCPVHAATNTNLETTAQADLRNQTKFSIGIWFKITTMPPANGGTLLVNRQGDSAQTWFRAMLGANLRANILQSAGNSLYVESDVKWAFNRWTFGGFSFDASLADADKIKIFINGVQVPTTIISQAGTITATQNTGNAIYRVGTYASAGNYPLVGNTQLCAVLIGSNWSEAEWQSWYNVGRGADITNCTHKWLLNDNSDTVVDSVGSANMTYSGTNRAWVNHF